MCAAQQAVQRPRHGGLVGVAVVAVLFVLGIAWAKWLPYASKSLDLLDTRTWSATSLFPLAQGSDSVSIHAAWTFTHTYFAAIWRAGLVALLVAAGIDALVPRAWLLRLLDRPGRWRQAFLGGLLSLPSMMCTCCTAPVAVSLRRSGTPTTAGLAYWIGNPLLNPAVLVFLFLVLPWQVGVVRLLVGGVLVFVVTALVARRFGPRTEPAARAPIPEAPSLRELPSRYLRSVLRLVVVLLPEYVVVVFLTGLFGGWLSEALGIGGAAGALAWVLVALVGTLLVVPTGGEIAVVVGLTAAGAGPGSVGILLITLPALSATSMSMVGRAFGWRVITAMAAAVALAGILAGGLLAALS